MADCEFKIQSLGVAECTHPVWEEHRNKIEEFQAILKKFEWSGVTVDAGEERPTPTCPCCGFLQLQNCHNDECELAKAMKYNMWESYDEKTKIKEDNHG